MEKLTNIARVTKCHENCSRNIPQGFSREEEDEKEEEKEENAPPSHKIFAKYPKIMRNIPKSP